MSREKTFAGIRQREWEQRREAIVDAAERVFSVKAFNETNIRDIAAEAGISHATIYRYFPDRQALFLEAFLRGVERILPSIDAVIAQKQGRQALEAIAETLIRFLSENDHYFRMMTHFMLDGDLEPGLLEKLNSAERMLLDKIEAVFAAGGEKQNSRALAHAFFAAQNGLLISFRNYPGRDKAEVLRHMQELGRLTARRFYPGG
ncbi:MAG: TetR/AcrR family transcriptional regulator [Desulfosalsimonadaceae bacterium]